MRRTEQRTYAEGLSLLSWTIGVVFALIVVLAALSIYVTRDNGYGPPPAGCHWEQTHSKGYYVRPVCP